jgi:hypothetical protein
MINRKAIPPNANPRVRQVTMDTAAVGFPDEVTKVAQISDAPAPPNSPAAQRRPASFILTMDP